MEQTLVLVGGFLGAGKTTLMLAAAARLREAGRSVGVITNDQGGELVDTRLALANGFDTEEIGGGCFCCRFSDLVAAAGRLRPDIILAEPVGSCTDLAATVLRPMRKLYGDRYRLAPLTVLVDPGCARKLLAADADPHLAYLFRKQLAEADLVRFTKADQYNSFPELPGLETRPISAYTGQGVGEWLDEVLNDGGAAGSHMLDIDYRRYAEAEAALGWLNWRAELRLRRPLTPASVVGPILEKLDGLLTSAGADIAHLKIFARAATGYLKASICVNGEPPSVDGRLDTPPALRHELIVNLRAKSPPELLEDLVERAVAELPGRLGPRTRQAFRPAPPSPEHRFTEVT
jgi:hypothetical protein